MGLFDFVKNAGEAIGKIAGSVGEGVASALEEELNDGSIRTKIEASGLNIKDLAIKVTGDRVKIYGVVEDQESAEKAVLLIGNTQGVASVEDAIKVRNPGAKGQFYTVKSGDSLSSIAQQFYGDSGLYQKIFAANKPPLTNPDVIEPGQTLRIPAKA